MLDLLYFVLIVVFVIDLPAQILFKRLFRKSVGFNLTIFLNMFGSYAVIVGYTMGKFGLIHMTWIGPLSMLVLYLMTKLLVKKVISPLNGLTNTVEEVADGKLRTEVNEKIKTRKDELGRIAKSIDKMLLSLRESLIIAEMVSIGRLHTAKVESADIKKKGDLDRAISSMIGQLNETVSEIQKSSEVIIAGAEELYVSSQEVAKGASTQAVSIEEVSASMEEMTVAITENANSASRTRDIADRSVDWINSVKSATNNAVSSMKSISERIGIMQDIAKKTDLLAINASIEATRAGQEGKGFSVVAQEIRKLAVNADEAARFITNLVRKMVEEVEESNNLLDELIPEVVQTSKLVQEITVASSEQLSSANQINSAIAQLNEVTQENASSSEELASSSQVFSEQAENLTNAISFFKLSEEDDDNMKEEMLQKIAEMNRFVQENFGKKNKKEESSASVLAPDEKKTSYSPPLTMNDTSDDDFESV